jgi:hypothetical protein
VNVTSIIAVLSAQRERLHTISRQAETVTGLAVAILGPRRSARLILGYWRFRDHADGGWRRVRRPAVVGFASHVVVLGAGFVLLLPMLTGGVKSDTPVIASAGGVLMTSMPPLASQVSRNSLALTEANRVEPTPTVPATPAPAASSRPPAAQPHAAASAPAAVAPPPGSGSGVAAIYSVFSGSPGLSWALRVARCESGYNPMAVNPYSGASGLFQFMPSTWNAHFAGWNIWDPVAQAKAALVFYNNGWTSAWTCK